MASQALYAKVNEKKPFKQLLTRRLDYIKGFWLEPLYTSFKQNAINVGGPRNTELVA